MLNHNYCISHMSCRHHRIKVSIHNHFDNPHSSCWNKVHRLQHMGLHMHLHKDLRRLQHMGLHMDLHMGLHMHLHKDLRRLQRMGSHMHLHKDLHKHHHSKGLDRHHHKLLQKVQGKVLQ